MRIVVNKPEFEKLISSDASAEIIAENHMFTEGPVWDAREKRLIFTDIPATTIFSWTAENGVEVFRKPSGFSNGLTFNRKGHLIACEHRTRAVTVSKDGESFAIAADRYQDKKLNSPNDVVASDDGTIFFSDPIYGLREGNGGPAEAELDFQGLYRITPDGELILITDSFERPNGLALSPDEKTLYVADTVRQHIRAFQIGPDWQMNGGQIWAELWDDEYGGRPDGMKVDENGNLFATGPGGIWVFNPQAELLGRLFFPDKTSNLAWGDDDLGTLYITSSSKVYRLRTNTRGLPLVK